MSFLFQMPLIVSYYTKNTPYEKEVVGLVESCEEFGLEHCIVGIEDRGSWEANCAYKPYFIREKMKEFSRPLLWVDADAVFLQPIRYEEFMFLDMVYYQEEEVQDIRITALAGTVYVNATDGGMLALDRWCHYSDEIIRLSGEPLAYMDQVSLHCTRLSKPPVHFGQLPIRYVKVFDRYVNGLDSKDIVIEHHQASRRFKNKGT